MSGLLDAVRNTEIPDIYAVQRVLGSDNDQEELFELARAAVRKVYGNKIISYGLIEMSDYSDKEASFFGLGSRMGSTRAYRMEPAEVIETALQAAEVFRHIILNSEHDVWYTAQILVDIVKGIREKSDVSLTLAAGERSPAAYSALREAGADRFLITPDTARMLTGEQNVGAKADTVSGLESIGFVVGGGCIVGLPGQNDSTVAAEILLMRENKVDMAGFGPFIPRPGTMLADYPAGSTAVTLRALAAARILMLDCNLPATAALIAKGCLDKALRCGASSVLQDVTPYKYRKTYDQSAKDIALGDEHEALMETIKQLGLEAD